MWLIVPNNKLAELESINSNFSCRKCTTILTTGGVHVTGIDKLGDDYWEAYHDFLGELVPFDGEPEFIDENGVL